MLLPVMAIVYMSGRISQQLQRRLQRRRQTRIQGELLLHSNINSLLSSPFLYSFFFLHTSAAFFSFLLFPNSPPSLYLLNMGETRREIETQALLALEKNCHWVGVGKTAMRADSDSPLGTLNHRPPRRVAISK